MATYSFLDCNATIVGPGGFINLASGAGVAEEGITFDPNGDIDTMTIAADGSGMHSLHADKSGTVTVRLLKTSPVNQKLSQMYSFQTASGSNHGQNTIALSNTVTGDVVTCDQVAFRKAPSLAYAVQGGLVEWVFNAVKIVRVLGGAT